MTVQPKPSTSTEKAASLAERLERGEIVHFPACPLRQPDSAAREFLRSLEQGGPAHKNISFDPTRGKVGGLGSGSSADKVRLRDVFAAFSREATAWLADALPQYSSRWKLDRCSYRPLEEATRNLRLHARNDLLHVDAFPTRPSNGWRLLRVFVNVNATEPRIWVTSDPFPDLLEKFGKEVGLPTHVSGLAWAARLLEFVPRLFRPGRTAPSEFDRFMHRFHNFLKENEQFQDHCTKHIRSFEPGCMWLCMTDYVSHAVLRGRHALEHSFFVHPATLAVPEQAPAALLASACGRAVVPQAA